MFPGTGNGRDAGTITLLKTCSEGIEGGGKEKGPNRPPWVAMRKKLKEKAAFLLSGLIFADGMVFMREGGMESVDEAVIEHPEQWLFIIVVGGVVVRLLVHEWISEWKMKMKKAVENIEKKVDAILERMD